MLLGPLLLREGVRVSYMCECLTLFGMLVGGSYGLGCQFMVGFNGKVFVMDLVQASLESRFTLDDGRVLHAGVHHEGSDRCTVLRCCEVIEWQLDGCFLVELDRRETVAMVFALQQLQRKRGEVLPVHRSLQAVMDATWKRGRRQLEVLHEELRVSAPDEPQISL